METVAQNRVEPEGEPALPGEGPWMGTHCVIETRRGVTEPEAIEKMMVPKALERGGDGR